MNNLKRVLSLALSGIMLVGMMAMGASAADFTDADEIIHQDAVDILVALDVINGQDDGSFNPKGNVTRAQMAKMIAVAMKGGNDVSTGVKSTASFTDIKGHWAESYIEYCYDLGIISGRGDGTFAPDANVTGLEAAKMVLTALGYDSEAYKLTGAQWATRTDELARIAKPALYESLSSEVVLTEPANRETAAQMIWNGLQNATMKYEPSTNTNNGEVTWHYINGDTMLKVRYNADIYTGTFENNANTDTSLEDGQISVRRNEALGAGATTTINTAANSRPVSSFPADIDVDYLGEEVQVIYKNGTRSTQTGPDKNDTIYGVFVTGTTNVVRTTRDKLAGVKKNNNHSIKVDGVEYEFATATENNSTVNAFSVYRNYLPASTPTYANTLNTEDEASTYAKSIAYANGDEVKVILDDAGKIATLYFTTAKLAVVTGLTSTKVTLNNGVGTIEIDKNDIYEGIAKDDVVTVTTLYKEKATDEDAYTIVKKAETVTGNLSAYKIDTDKQNNRDYVNITVDGTAQKLYHASSTKITSIDDLGISKAITTLDSTVLDAEVEAYLVNGFVGAVKKTSAAATNYSVVMEIRKSTQSSSVFSNFQLYVMDGEGTKTIINVNDEVEDKTLTAMKNLDDSNNRTGTENKVIDLSNIAKMKDKFNAQKDSAVVGRWNANLPAGVTNAPETVFEVGDIITYTKDKDGNADVTIEARPATGRTGYDKDTKEIDGVVTSTDAVIFVLTKGSYNAVPTDGGQTETGAGLTIKAYKAADLGDVPTAKPVAVAQSSGKAVAGFISLGEDPAGATSNEVYGIVASTGSTVKDGTQYTISVNGEAMTVTVKGTDRLTKGQVVKFEPTSDNIYANAGKFALPDATKAFTVYVDEYDADRNIITFYDGNLQGKDPVTENGTDYTRFVIPDNATTKTYAVKSDVKIYAVDVDDASSSVASASSVTGFNTNTGKKNAIIVIDNSTNKEVQVIVVETSGQKDIR